jgi:ligand-binding SRPBCC domain-containing protein
VRFSRTIKPFTNALLPGGLGGTSFAFHGTSACIARPALNSSRDDHFRDEIVRGPFRTFKHDHDFTTEDFGTLMTDVCEFDAPLGPLGWLASRLVLTRHLTQLLEERGQIIRRTAESDDWRRFLPDAAQRASVSR